MEFQSLKVIFCFVLAANNKVGIKLESCSCTHYISHKSSSLNHSLGWRIYLTIQINFHSSKVYESV